MVDEESSSWLIQLQGSRVCLLSSDLAGIIHFCALVVCLVHRLKTSQAQPPELHVERNIHLIAFSPHGKTLTRTAVLLLIVVLYLHIQILTSPKLNSEIQWPVSNYR